MKTRILIVASIILLTAPACKQNPPSSSNQPQPVAQAFDNQRMIIARVYIKPGSEADFIEAAREMITNSNKEEGCLGYMLYQDPYEKTNFIFVETYKNQAAVDAHFAKPYFKDFGTRIADLTSKPTEIKVLDIAGVK